MRIGVVIPAFNAEQWIGDAIASVLAQTHRDWWLVVVDDGSTDGTSEVVSRFSDSRIRLVRQANAGVAAARNRGICNASEAVLFLDADDTLAPDAMSRLGRSLAAAPGAVASVGAYAYTHCRRSRMPPSGELLERLLVGNLFANCGHLLIRREALNAAGGFRAELAFGEDWEFCIRLAMCGPFAAIPDRSPVLFVRQHNGGTYRRLAMYPASFVPCTAAIFANPTLTVRFDPARLTSIRRRTEAENAWIVGRELLRQGNTRDGRSRLWGSFLAAPSTRHALLLLASLLRLGPFTRYPSEASPAGTAT